MTATSSRPSLAWRTPLAVCPSFLLRCDSFRDPIIIEYIILLPVRLSDASLVENPQALPSLVLVRNEAARQYLLGLFQNPESLHQINFVLVEDVMKDLLVRWHKRTGTTSLLLLTRGSFRR